MRAAALLLLPLVLLAGCLDASERDTGTRDDDPTPQPTSHRLSGVFTREATQADVAEAQALAQAEGGDMAVMESFPMQLSVTGLAADACARLAAALDAKPYVASVRACQEVQPAGDPETPTGTVSSPPGDAAGPWGFRGSFTPGFTDEDVRAVCVAATGNESCAMMKSLPPQYAFSYPTLETCEAARGRVLDVPHVAEVSRCLGE